MKVFLLICALAVCTVGQTRIFITHMENDFDTFLSAAMLAKKIPVVITMDESNAEYIVVGASAKGDNKWSDTIFGNEKDRNQGSVKIVNPTDKTIVFAASAGDKSFWFGGLKKTGQKKVAERLADKIKPFFVDLSKKPKN
jgi:hypothetical protein